MDDESTQGAPAAGLGRRLAALVYDGILVLALWFVATLAVLPLSGGQAITPAAQGPGPYFYRAYLVLFALGYFGWSWTRTGQTLGMRCWRIRLVAGDATPPRWPAALLRFATGMALALAAGLGVWLAREPGWSARDLAAAALLLPAAANFAWPALDARGRSLQDIACRSRVVRVA